MVPRKPALGGHVIGVDAPHWLVVNPKRGDAALGVQAVIRLTIQAPTLRQGDQVKEDPNWSLCSVHFKCVQFVPGLRLGFV